MSDWRTSFKKWSKRSDFVEVHPQIFQEVLDDVAQLEEKFSNPTCHRGHSGYPLTLWDCPTCVENERKQFRAEVERLRGMLKQTGNFDWFLDPDSVIAPGEEVV